MAGSLLAALWLAVGFFAGELATPPPPQHGSSVELDHLRTATALLYQQDTHGNMKFDCTATAIAEADGGYVMLSASHCVNRDDAAVSYYFSFDDSDALIFERGELVSFGKMEKGDDYAFFYLPTKRHLPTICIRDSSKVHPREAVAIVGGSYGMGKLDSLGTVMLPYLNRPFFDNEKHINWLGCFVIDINMGPGASGSIVYSLEQRAAIGILVGYAYDESRAICVPINRIKR